jgi:hypothetical protein
MKANVNECVYLTFTYTISSSGSGVIPITVFVIFGSGIYKKQKIFTFIAKKKRIRSYQSPER